ELPPSSFFISDPLLVGLTVFVLFYLAKPRQLIDRTIAVPVLVGLLVPIALVLAYSGMSFRYRLEFYPFFYFCALLGFGVLLSRANAPPLRWFALAAWGGILTAHLMGLLYMYSRLGDVQALLHGGDVISYYGAQF